VGAVSAELFVIQFRTISTGDYECIPGSFE
jgi:hypothetical protein